MLRTKASGGPGVCNQFDKPYPGVMTEGGERLALSVVKPVKLKKKKRGRQNCSAAEG